MRTRALCFFLLLLFPALSAGDEGRREAAIRGIDWLLNEKFDRAYALYDSIATVWPDRPEGHLGKATVLYNRGLLLDGADERFDEARLFLDRSVAATEDLIDDRGESAELFFWLGSAHALRATVAVMQRDVLDGMVDGMRSRDDLRAALEFDSDYIDARFGLAFTDYMIARQPKLLGVVARLISRPKGSRFQFLAEIDRIAEEGTYMSALARSSRAYIELYFERHPAAARHRFADLLRRYPDSVDYRIRDLDCMLALTVTGRRDFRHALLDSVAVIDSLAVARKWELEDWTRTKLIFIDGFARYLIGDWDAAESRLEAYLEAATKKSWLRGPAELTLGKLADLRGDRVEAVRHYRRAKKRENVWGSHREAEHHLEEVFAGEEPRTRPEDKVSRYPDRP